MPDIAAMASATSDVRRIRNTALRILLLSFVFAVVGSVLTVWGRFPRQVGLVVAFSGAMFSFIYAIVWRRAFVAAKALQHRPPWRVQAFGWCRAGDGINYGLFGSEADGNPDAVLRLPIRRDIEAETEAWLFGNVKPSRFGGVALVGPIGLLATGRILPKRRGSKLWARRTTEPGKWVYNPTTDRLPPGGA